MTSSPPNKLFDGQTGFPTPNAPPEDTGCRVFIIPSDEEWFALFMDAALKLTYEWAWFKNGTMTQAEAAAAWQVIIDDAYDRSLLGTCLINVPAPWWDEASADDADDEMPVLTQVWYGEIAAAAAFIAEDTPSLTFLDDLGIWLIAGFIAYAGLPGAAIAFVPVARKFVLYFKQTPTGAIVNILADFLHIADIDTYGVEDKVASILVTMPDDATTLYVEQAETSNPLAGDHPDMRVIRSRLSEGDFADPAYRYNADCDCIQYSPDGGTTWNDAPNSDPRHADPFRLPARTGGTPDCDAAANMVAWIKGVIDECTSICCVGGIVVALINKILQFAELIFAEAGGELLNLIISVAGGVFDIGCGLLTSAFTSDQYDLLLCIFLCHSNTDGQVTPLQFGTIQTQVTAQLNTTAALVVNLFLSLQGEVGLSNAGAIGTVTGDCTGCTCGWCFAGDFTADDGGWSTWAGESLATWTSGQGWVGSEFNSTSNTECVIGVDFTATEITYFAFHYTKPLGSGSNNVALFQLYSGGAIVFTSSVSTDTGTDLFLANAVPNITADQCRIVLNAGTSGGDTIALDWHMEGNGSNPFGSNNC